MTCPYITTLERACGRASVQGEFCQFHGWLHQLDNMTLEDLAETTWSDIPELNKIRLRLHDAIGALSK